MPESPLNAVYSSPWMRRRYEVWFLRLGLADGSGAWWFRYLIMNLASNGCPGNPRSLPAQVWATWFPRASAPQSFIQGFPREQISLSAAGASPFHLQIAGNRMDEDSCSGHLQLEGRDIRWDLRYRSTFSVSLSDKGWIGFSRTPHSNAVFAGEITFDGRTFRGEPFGFGLQGHNCGYRHRSLWTWTHCGFPAADGSVASFEALEYDMPLGLRFRRALFWTGRRLHEFRKFKVIRRERSALHWEFECSNPRDGTRLVARIDGSGHSLHRVLYLKTDCSSTFEVSNNSLARAVLEFTPPGKPAQQFSTEAGAALEMTGD
jgi:hypothetical protein